MTTAIVLSLIAAAIVALAAYVAVRRALSASRDGGAEARLMSRLDGVLDSIARVREESRSAVQDKIGELLRHAEEQDRAARDEIQRVLKGTTDALVGRFEKLQASNEQRLTEIRSEVERKLSETLQSSSQAFKDVTERLAQLGETNQNIMQFSKDLHELQSILKAPRMRGEVGEIEMERLLRDCLAPEQFDTQHEIVPGQRVDAVILNPEGKLPIDSKFPLEAWRRVHNSELGDAERTGARRDFVRAVKGHIDSIAAKYIHPPQTLDFAVMYVPVEGVYYEIMESAELTEHARLKRIFPASPTTFWALLQVTVVGFRGLQISENAKRIASLLTALRNDLEKFRDAFDKANKQLGHAKINMDEAAGHLDRFQGKLQSVHGPSSADVQQLDEPSGEPAP